nr:hypothetical protein [Tanacetum cinerariifolium]
YVVPTGRVVVPTGRYVVPTGRVVVPIGRVISPGRISTGRCYTNLVNGHVRTLSHDTTYAMTWEILKKKLTDKYFPKGKTKKLEIELWNLKVKGNDIGRYTQRFQILALMCTKFISNETEKVDNTDAIKFTKPSVDDINIVESERYPPDEYLHPFEPYQMYQVNNKAVQFIEPYKKPEPSIYEADQNDQSNQNDQSDHVVQTDEILNDD